MVEYEILPSDYMSRYEFDLSKLKPWIDEGISPKTLWKFEVRFDNQSNRIVYPIKNLNGEIINVSGRTADPDWKEKKLRKYTYTHPLGVLDVLYGLYENKEAIEDANEVVLFEGAKSVMKAREYGICNTAALLTSHLNELQMKILIGMGVDIVFALDKGIDILEDKHILPLRNFVSVKYICDTENLIREKDSPVDSGKEAFLKLYSKRRWIA